MKDTRAIYLPRRAIENRWCDRSVDLTSTYEFHSFMVFIFTNSRSRTRIRRGWTVVVAWCDIVTRKACRCPNDAPKTQGRGKMEEDTDVGVWEKAEEEAKRDRIAASVEVYTESIPRRVMLARSSGTARGRHKFCDRSWSGTLHADFSEDRLSIYNTFLENRSLLPRLINMLNESFGNLLIIEFVFISFLN